MIPNKVTTRGVPSAPRDEIPCHTGYRLGMRLRVGWTLRQRLIRVLIQDEGVCLRYRER